MTKVNIEELAKKLGRLMLLCRYKYPVMAEKDLKEARQLGLTGSSIKLLQYLDILGKCNIGKVSQIINISGSRGSKIAHDLQESRLIRKIRSATDEREVLIGLTAEGKRIVKAISDYEISQRRDIVCLLVKEFSEKKLKVLSEIADSLTF